MMADNSPRPNIRTMPLCDSDKIAFSAEEQQKILTLRQSPRADHKAIASFVAKQDSSDDAMSILELDESPSETRRRRDEERAAERRSATPASTTPSQSIVVPDEVIELPNGTAIADSAVATAEPPLAKKPPVKSVRKIKDHVYETIDNDTDDTATVASAAASQLDVNANQQQDADVCQLVKVVEHHMETIEVVSIGDDRSVRASSLKRDHRNKTPEKKVTFLSSMEDCQITPDGQIVKELVGTRYPTVFG